MSQSVSGFIINPRISSVLSQLLPETSPSFPVVQQTENHFAPVNIALIKYWGKRDNELNLPVTDSLSIALGKVGTHTQLSLTDAHTDDIRLNGQAVAVTDPFFIRTKAYLDLFRSSPEMRSVVDTHNDVPTGAGLASSASGYAALVLALNELFGWQLATHQLSILARIGSGSACRSLWQGFVHWQAGQGAEGMDSYAQPLAYQVPQLRIGLLMLSHQVKPVSSREGMKNTVQGVSLYPAWSSLVATHLAQLQSALAIGDIAQIGTIAEHYALAMHATMLSASPPLCYWLPETLAQLQKIWQARAEGLACWATLDAGPNIKLLFSETILDQVMQYFPELQVINPFESPIESLMDSV